MFDTTQQLTSETHLVGNISQPTTIYIPDTTIGMKKKKKRQLPSVTKTSNLNEVKFLSSTTKVPLNIGTLNDILFTSTISRVPSFMATKMKRHASLSSDNNSTAIYFSSTTARRYSQPPETTNKRHSQTTTSSIIQPYDTTTNGNSSIIHERRTSVQSDATSSTELIRRFSSGSTTSTIATSISTSSLTNLENNVITKCNTNHNNHNIIDSGNHNNNALIKSTTLLNETTTLVSQHIPNEQQQQQQQQQQQIKVRDPGHACDTKQKSLLEKEKKTDEASYAAQQPIWVNSEKAKENPLQYQQVLNYLRENKIALTSALPLKSPCIFYFSDNSHNNKQSYMSSIQPLFQCDTVWQFSSRWRAYKEMGNKPSQMLMNQNIYCFKKGVEPMWEDSINENGGSLTIHLKYELLDNVFEWILCLLNGGFLYEDGIVGIVLSRRNRGDRIELWLDESNSTEKSILNFKEKLCSLLPTSCHNEINASRYKKHF